MRFVAVLSLVLAGLATMPVAPAANECVDPCRSATIPSTPVDAKGSTYYVYAQALQCSSTDNHCLGKPGPRVMGLVYEETNCEGGLQRFRSIHCAPDEVTLV